jgi:hypothetical protein
VTVSFSRRDLLQGVVILKLDVTFIAYIAFKMDLNYKQNVTIQSKSNFVLRIIIIIIIITGNFPFGDKFVIIDMATSYN